MPAIKLYDPGVLSSRRHLSYIASFSHMHKDLYMDVIAFEMKKYDVFHTSRWCAAPRRPETTVAEINDA